MYSVVLILTHGFSIPNRNVIYYRVCAGATAAATDVQETCPLDINSLPVPSEPTPTFSPEISSESRRSEYQRPKGSPTESMTELRSKAEKTKTDSPKENTPTTSAQDGSKENGDLNTEEEEAWKTVGWFP